MNEIKEYEYRKRQQEIAKDINKGVTIRDNNVRDLWTLYEECGRNYEYFEDFVDNEVVMCANCEEYTTRDYAKDTCDGYICDQCIEDGYGA
jgi:formylmethanofuran dehydrogenase subunit E